MGTHNHADIATGCAIQPGQVVKVCRAGVNNDVACIRIAHQIAVGAWPGHHARVGSRQAHHVF